MPCRACKSIFGQMMAIVLAGTTIGVVDSRLRPVKLDRAKVPYDPPGPGPGPGPAPPVPTPGFKETAKDQMPRGQITLTEGKTLYDQQAVFIDARKEDKFAAGHVKGAYRISEEDFRSGDPAILAAIPRSATLVVYCSGGDCDESEQVARMLDGSGYKTIYVLHDGFPGWQKMGFPSGEGNQ